MLFKLALAEGFQEETAFVAEDFRCEQYDIRDV